MNHVLGEARWTAPLLAGRTIAEVGDTLDGDLLGGDPLAAWNAERDEAAHAAGDPEIGERIVHLSFGETPAPEYLRQLTMDYLVHSWDLAVTIGVDDLLDAELVDAVSSWFRTRGDAYRTAGVVATPVPTDAAASARHRLLAQFGRDPIASAALAAVARFSGAFARHDTDAVMAHMTDDCIFESTTPPDGQCHRGAAAVHRAWTEFFRSAPDGRFETEEQITSGDRVIVRWRYTWPTGHVRGVDMFRTRHGLVSEKLSYVKG